MRVMKARSAYQPSSMGSLDRTAYMLMMQHEFPYEYDENLDHYTCADHDRLRDYSYDDFMETTRKHTGNGDMGIGSWVRNASPKAVLNYLIEVMHLSRKVHWTGWRVLGTVNVSNGYPVYSLEAFAKHPESKTEVYSGDEEAPNVEQSEIVVSNDGRYLRRISKNSRW